MKQVTFFLVAAVCFLMLTITVDDANGNAVVAPTGNQQGGAHPHAHRPKRFARSNSGKSASSTHHNGTHHAHGTNANHN